VCEHAVELGAEQELAFRAMPRLEEELTRVFGPKHTHLSFADSVDPVMVAVCHGHTASLCGADPPTDRCLSADTIRQLKEEGDRLYCERYTGQQGGRQGTRLAMQPFLSEVLQRFEDTASGRGPLKLALYSAHDTVVAPVVAALSAFDCRCVCVCVCVCVYSHTCLLVCLSMLAFAGVLCTACAHALVERHGPAGGPRTPRGW
jgi:hypothetical protein